MKRFSTGAIPGHNVAIGAQPDEDGPLCLYEDHLTAVHEAEQEALMANDCMGMIHDHLKLRLGEDMKSTPAMMYPEAIDHAIVLHRDKAVQEEREAIDGVLCNDCSKRVTTAISAREKGNK